MTASWREWRWARATWSTSRSTPRPRLCRPVRSRGVRLWFTPLAVLNFFGSQSSADSFRDSIAEKWTHLYDANLALPPANIDWYHAVPIDLVFKLNAATAWGWTTYNRWLNLKLSTHAPCGKYRAKNAWAECRVDLQVRVFHPSFIA